MGNRNLTYKWWKDKMANKIVIEYVCQMPVS